MAVPAHFKINRLKLNPFANRRFKPLDIALAILFAGCTPSILMAVVSYSILTRTLESKIVIDRRTLVQTLSQLVSYDLVRSSEVVEYYQNLPLTERMVRRPYGDSAVQDWMAESYYSHPRLDGMFVTDAAGKVIAAVPLDLQGIGQECIPERWREQAKKLPGAFVSPIHARMIDNRLCTFVIAAVRAKTGEVLGYMSATLLVERIGRRISAFDFGEKSEAQIIDQNGFPLFDINFGPNTDMKAKLDPGLLEKMRSTGAGHFQFGDNLFSANPVEGTHWIASLEQPLEVAYRPIHDLVGKTSVLAGWLIVGTTLTAFLVSRLYKNQLLADDRISQATLFNEKILANMPIGIALISPATRKIVQHNQSWLAMMKKFGGLPADVDAGALSLSDVRLEIDGMFAQVKASGIPVQARELEAVSAAGETHFVTVNLLRLQDAYQKIQGILFLVADNTAEVTLRRELIGANAAKDQFLALLSHELRNPLSPVIMMVAELEQRIDGSPEVKHAVEVIRRNVELEAHLIDDLLDVTRIVHNKLELNPSVIDAHETIKRSLEICQKDISVKKLDVVLDLNALEHHINADPARLQQVFWNLIKNAVKFTPAGRITIASRNANGNLVVEVADTGIGIDPEGIDKIFRAFEQVERSITRRFGGLGLGLAISKAMVDAHGGALTARSDGHGKGAVFTVELAAVEPVPEQYPPPIRAQPADDDGQNARRKILVVDDHEDTCMGMKLLLERRGYTVRIAHGVQAALALALEDKLDLMISDLGLPDGTGFELMEKIRHYSDLRGVALSGFGTEEDVARSKNAGFAAHLIKPVNIENLDAILKKIFDA